MFEKIVYGFGIAGGIVGANIVFYLGVKEGTYGPQHYMDCNQSCDCSQKGVKLTPYSVAIGLVTAPIGAIGGAMGGVVCGPFLPIIIPAMIYSLAK